MAGVLVPRTRLRVELPIRSWTQRSLRPLRRLCGNLNIRIGAADHCPAVTAGGFVIASIDLDHQCRSAEFGRDAQKRSGFT